MQTYGISPKRFFKLFEHEGYQVLVHVSEDDDSGEVACVLEGCIPELNDVGTTTIRIGVNGDLSDEKQVELARKIFDSLEDAEAVVNTFLSQAGPAVQSMLGLSDLPSEYEVSKVKYDNGVEIDGKGTMTKGPHMFSGVLRAQDEDEDEE